jgi:GTP 3',8-cyclase
MVGLFYKQSIHSGSQIVNPVGIIMKINDAAKAIEKNHTIANKKLAHIILAKKLYFRISLIGSCNMSCAFCHNEGGSTIGRLKIEDFNQAIENASELGFTRVQLTGGEPLLVKNISDYIISAKNYFADVGVTTNGILLRERINSMLTADINRIHISLQTEMLESDGSTWSLPQWLENIIIKCSEYRVITRLNLPVPANKFNEVREFLRTTSNLSFDINAFSMLTLPGESPYPKDKLIKVVEEENSIRVNSLETKGRVFVRGYLPSQGFRCGGCEYRENCQEESRSLRFGADKILRPCLASRQWDIPVENETIKDNFRTAAILATDY